MNDDKNDGNLFWYGQHQTLKNQGKLDYSYMIPRPNGSNLYIFKRGNGESEHVPVEIVLKDSDISPSEMSELLQQRINDYLSFKSALSPEDLDNNSNIVHTMTYTCTGKIQRYTAVYSDGHPVTVHPDELSKLRSVILDQDYNINNRDNHETDREFNNNIYPSSEVNINSFFDEPEIKTFAIKFSVDDIEAEYFSVCMFVYAAYHNQYLRIYPDRVSFNVRSGIARISVPFWSQQDLKHYNDLIKKIHSNLVLPKSHKFYDVGRVKLSNEKWYDLPSFIPLSQYNFDSDFILVDGEKVYLDQGNDLKRFNFIVDKIKRGFVPFDQIDPDNKLDDANIRIKVEKIGPKIVVMVTPTLEILATYNLDQNVEILTQEFQRRWNSGEFLTFKGHARYQDSYSPIPASELIKIVN